jgi:2-succinyl-6-hydroxy-2,4-cyclohexadiene-1-carboxylate synthase
VSTDPTRVVLAHGFTQTARSWAEFEALLAERLDDVETVAVDLPGHGDCAAPPDADLWTAAEHLVDLGGTAHYIGYSMGGRVALHAALRAPDRVRSLVLIGATAGIDDDVERSARRTADERLAQRIEAMGVEAFVDEWLTNPLFAGLDARSARRDDRLRNTAAGLAASLRSTGTGTQEPLWGGLGDVTQPVLVLAGEHDAKFRALGERLAAGFPQASFRVIGGAGHTVHLEQPAATADAVADWFRSSARR